MKNLAERLVWARLQKTDRDGIDFTQGMLAQKAGVSQGSIGHLESGRTNTSRKLTAIAAALDVSPIWLAEGKGHPFNTRELVYEEPREFGLRKVPLLNHAEARCLIDARADPHNLNPSDYILSDSKLGDRAFAIEIEDGSMHPDFIEGDRVIIDPTISPVPGDFVVAHYDSTEIVFRKFRPRGVDADGDPIFEIAPINDDYASFRSDTSLIFIIGTMVEHRRYRRR